MRARYVVLAAALLSGACQFGTRPSKYLAARNGQGAHIQLLGSWRGSVEGELLVLADSQLLVMRDAKVTVAPFGRTRQIFFKQLGPGYTWFRGMPQEAQWRAQVRLVARYPQGLTNEQLQGLLMAQQQVAPDTLQ